MKTKNFKINLKKYKSLYPSILPCYDEFGNEIILDNDNLSQYISGDYNMIVSDIIIPLSCIELDNHKTYKKIAFLYSSDNVCVDNEIYTSSNGKFIINGFEYSIKENDTPIPFTTFNLYYNYGCKYHNIIKSLINPNKVYTNAIEFYNSEVFPKTNELEEYYRNLDYTYYSYGGDLMFNWLCDNFVKKIKIPEKFSEYWDCEFLYYPEIIEWLAWFKIRYDKYNGEDVDYTNPNCCDYKEYIDKGGDEFYEWLKLQKEIINTPKHEIPNIVLTLLIENNIDDLGIMSSNVKNWEEGEIVSGVTKDNSVKYDGFLTLYNNNVWKSTNTSSTSGYDEKYKEIFFKKDSWDKVGYETINNVNTLSNIELNNNVYEIKNNECVLIDNLLFLVQNVEIIKFNKTYYYVYRNDYNIPYIKINGHIQHLIFDKATKKYYLKNNNNKLSYIKLEKAIKYKGTYYFKKKNNIEIKKNNCLFIYPIYKQYVKCNDFYYIIKDNELYKFNNYKISEEKRNGYVTIYNADYDKVIINVDININDSLIRILSPFKELSNDEVSGYTDSKLDSLKPLRKCFDDVGNELPGMFIKTENDTFIQPKENSTLDIYFHVGDTSDFEIKKDDDGNVEVDANKNPLYYGNIIIDIEFYFKDVNGNVIEITRSKNINDTLQSKQNNTSYAYEDNISCVITYLIGAVLTQKIDGDNTIYEYDSNNSFGIEYKDYVHLIKKETTYFMTTDISYPIYYWEFEYEYNNTVLYDYNEKKVETKRTYFRYKLNKKEDLDELMPSIPLIKEEMYNGITTQPIVKRNVNIDRGNSASLDKHLRLTEIGTMEALENYGNGIWNIHSNTQ